ncbi:hypothetical protein RZE82_00805 [Mollicutes bacterium LVI A0039]|nr:hypothetical protein RZE82_00805 [Mollicutes bacterium LVI A0039]
MRRFIIATNNSDWEIPNAKIIEMDIAEIAIIFNQDTLNVLSQGDYQRLLESEYMYGIEIEFDNYLTGYRQLLKHLLTTDPELGCVYDVSIKRYINHHELTYFANNKLLPSKLFNIEIVSDQSGTLYQTIGLASIGHKEFQYKSNLYLNEEDFQIFKAIVTNFVIGKKAKVNINANYIDYQLIEADNFVEFRYARPSRIFEFFIQEDLYLNQIRYALIKHHWANFLELKAKMPKLGNYLVNKATVHDLGNFEVAHVEEFTIVCEEINYNQDNLFYAYKYL